MKGIVVLSLGFLSHAVLLCIALLLSIAIPCMFVAAFIIVESVCTIATAITMFIAIKNAVLIEEDGSKL